MYLDRHANRPLYDRDDQHFRKFPPRPDADAYAMNDVMNVHRAIRDRVHDYDVYDDRMNEANVADELDADFELDDDNDHIQNGFHRRNADDTCCCTTEVLLPSFATELIVDLNCKIEHKIYVINGNVIEISNALLTLARIHYKRPSYLTYNDDRPRFLTFVCLQNRWDSCV